MSAEKLAYFFEASDLATVFGDWPAEVGLVLCLGAAGACEMLLHHAEEDRETAVLRKAAALLGADKGGFAVVPEMAGHPTRRIVFSDQQKLLALVESEGDIAELAADFLLNYRFEKERAAKAALAEKIAAKAVALKSDSGMERKAEPVVQPFRWRPRLHLSELRSTPPVRRRTNAIPEGYVPAEALSAEDWQILDAELRVDHRGVRLLLAPEQVTIKTVTRLVQEVGFSEESARFVVPRKAVDDWKPGEPLVIDMPESRFPDSVRRRLAAGARAAEVTITGRGVFVTPGVLLPPPAPQPEAGSRRRGFLSPMSMGMIAVTMVGLTLGTMINAVEMPSNVRIELSALQELVHRARTR